MRKSSLAVCLGEPSESDGQSVQEQQSGQTAIYPIEGLLQRKLQNLWEKAVQRNKDIDCNKKGRKKTKLKVYIHNWAEDTEDPRFARDARMVLDVLKDKLAPHIERLTLEESVGNIFHGTPNLMHYTAKKDNVDYSLGFRLTQNKDNLLVYSGISQFLPHETSNLRKILEPMHLTSPPGLIFSYLFKSENNLLNADRKGVDVAIARYGFRVKPILVEDLPVVMDEIKTATKILEQPENIKWLQYATHLLTIASEGSRNC